MFGCDILGQDSSSSVWTWCSLIFNGLPPNRPRRTSCSWSKTTLVALLKSLVLWARAWWCPWWWKDGPSAEGSILLRGQCFFRHPSELPCLSRCNLPSSGQPSHFLGRPQVSSTVRANIFCRLWTKVHQGQGGHWKIPKNGVIPPYKRGNTLRDSLRVMFYCGPMWFLAGIAPGVGVVAGAEGVPAG